MSEHKKGNPTIYEVAEKLCTAISADLNKMFTSDAGKKLSDKTIRHHHGLISSVLSAAVKWGVILSNPADRVDLGKMPKYRPNYYDDEQLTAMFAVLDQEPLRYRAIVYLTIDTGMRSGEIAGICWSDINLDNGIIIVDKQR